MTGHASSNPATRTPCAGDSPTNSTVDAATGTGIISVATGRKIAGSKSSGQV